MTAIRVQGVRPQPCYSTRSTHLSAGQLPSWDVVAGVRRSMSEMVRSSARLDLRGRRRGALFLISLLNISIRRNALLPDQSTSTLRNAASAPGILATCSLAYHALEISRDDRLSFLPIHPRTTLLPFSLRPPAGMRCARPISPSATWRASLPRAPCGTLNRFEKARRASAVSTVK
ncbi:hypothetical protein PENSPDRAFT_248674 [Peniophora sp. CONT]|nr:hypothetical protein PENSPDRAFT_248674 [Peniophora sp. CONT]